MNLKKYNHLIYMEISNTQSNTNLVIKMRRVVSFVTTTADRQGRLLSSRLSLPSGKPCTLAPNLWYKSHQIPKLKWFSSRFAVAFVKWMKNEDVVGATPTEVAPATSEWSTILLPAQVWLILEVWCLSITHRSVCACVCVYIYLLWKYMMYGYPIFLLAIN